MKPPPPILPASGYVTASVKAIATAASTALPPCLKICSAVSAAYLSATATAEATMAPSARDRMRGSFFKSISCISFITCDERLDALYTTSAAMQRSGHQLPAVHVDDLPRHVARHRLGREIEE